MTIPVPPDLSTDAADAYRAGYAAGAEAVRRAVMGALSPSHWRPEGGTRVNEPVRDPGWRQAPGYDLVNMRWVGRPTEQPGDREPTGLDGRGA